MKIFDIARKTTSILANLSLLLNSFLPFVLAIQPVQAQSVEELSPTPTPVEIIENSPIPTPEIVISETPTPSPEVTPEITPEITPKVEVTPEATPTIEPTVAPENIQPQQPQNNNDNQNNNSPEANQVTPTVLPTITPTPTPVVKEIEQVCLSESDQIRNSLELDWNYDTANDIYETREKVKLGVKYIFPQDDKVTVTFSCLPKDELLRSTLKIKRVKTSDLKLPNIENIGDYAYDITTDMRDGVFRYDITLPKLSDSEAKVSYIEKSLEEAKLVAIPESEIKSINNLEQQTDLVKAIDIDHFTIFMVTGVWPTTSNNNLVSGEGTSQIRWPAGGSNQSGLGFVGESDLNLETLTSTGNSFILGSLTHYNHPVSSAIVWADLKITLGGLSTPKDFTFRVQIDETSNTQNLTGCSEFQITNTPCDDKVTFPNSISNQIITVNEIDYTLIIDGFKREINGSTLDSFVTEENKDNTAYLVGHFTPVGRIIVDKVTDPSGDATSFSFTTTGAGYNSFSLTDSATPNNQVLPANRTYSVDESTISGWTKINTNCVSSLGDTEVASNLELDPGEVIECTFTNAKNIASLKVVKNIVPSNDSGKFNLFINGTEYASNIGNTGETGFKTVSSGTATFSETAGTGTNLSDYTTTYSTGCDNGQTTLSIGETKTCTITNTRKAYCGDGIINGSETCDGDNLGSYSATDFQCNSCSIELKQPKVTICHATGENNNPYSTQTPNKSANVDDHASHIGPVWYPDISLNWGDIIPPFAYIGGTFPGLNWTTAGQTIYNNNCQYPSGTINVVKVISNGGQNYSDFSFSVNGKPAINFENDGTNQIQANVGVNYTITETPQPGYQVVYNNCKNISVTAGETKTCTITNNKYAKLTVIKQVDTNNDGIIDNQNATDWTWDIAKGAKNIATGQTKELIPGSYTISEDQKSDYRLKEWTCSDGSHGTVNSIGITLSPGDDLTCTFINTRRTGNIKVCKVIIDNKGKIVDGSAVADSVFSISGLNQTTSQGAPAGVIGTATFTAPLGYTDKLFGSTVKNAACVTYENLVPGNYYYQPESVSNNFWAVPKYNDGIASQNSLKDNFYEYSGQLFDEDLTNDGHRQTSADGHIVLEADQTRTLIVLNQYKFGNINVTKFNDINGNGYQDEGESNLSDWTVNLTGQASAVTDASGLVTFSQVTAGNYRLSETLKDGWMQTNISCDGDKAIDNDNSHRITLKAGQNLNCKIGNRQLAKVTVYKFNDLNGNGQKDDDESNLSNWQINLTDQTSLNTDENGQVVFNDLVPGNYDLSENVRSENGWRQTNIYCEDSGFGVKITAPSEAYGHHGNCEGWNGCGDAATCALWACQAKGYNQLVSYGADKPCNQFHTCHLFHSKGSVDWNWSTNYRCPVRGVTDIVCSNGSGSGDYYDHGYVSGNHLTLNPGQNKICYIGNRRLESKLNISKSNNTGGNQLSPGDSVEYTITLGFIDNNIDNLKVTDLLSDGFKYHLGSYRVFKNGTDVTSQVGEPQYHSPGLWDLSPLGQLTPEDEVKLVYTADIASDQQAGKYADLAYASAVYGYNSSASLLALATDEGYVDTNFVGTQVIVNRSHQNSVSAEVERTETISGQVLGASTQMPATGAAAWWLVISSILGFFGLILIKHDKISKSMAKKVLSILILPLFLFLSSTNLVSAANLSVRLEEPKTPGNIKELRLQFVVLDISGNQITAKCLKKGPNDSDFSQYGSDIILSAGGNASQCYPSAIIDRVGSYQFKVNANGLDSNIVNLDYNDSTPGTPRDYHKENINSNNCDFKIHFKTADDQGRTVKVELYRSTDSAFSANTESLVHSVNIGSDQESDIYNSVPDCSKAYYYALRAFDNTGNGSGIIGDTITVKTIYTDTTITGTPIQGAIPVSGNNISPESDTDGQSPSDIPSDASDQNQSTGQILGSQVQIGNFITNHKIISAVIGLVLLAIIIYAFTKIRKNKKGSFRK